MDQPTAENALEALKPLIGEWNVEAKWPGGESFSGKMSFQWLDSGRHVIQRGSIDHPMAPANVSIIGCDAAKGVYYQLYTDERNVCRVYEMTLLPTGFTLTREGEPFAQRYVGTFGEDGNTITGAWEFAEDGKNFQKDFELNYRRVT